MTPDFGARVPALRARVETALDAALPSAEADGPALYAAMRYACTGGKRLRALLVYAAAEGFGEVSDAVDDCAAAVELIHAYSLVHDDLPAMDDDDLRRGRPTVHKAFDEATAILVGDALQSLAFAVLLNPAHGSFDRARAALLLAQAAGERGMVCGQALDLAAEGRSLNLPELERLHALKTGALIQASVLLGAIAAGMPSDAQAPLETYGAALGLAYQIQDDVLDETADAATLGKTPGKDRAQAKSTFPALLGLAGAKAKAGQTFAEARAALAPLGERAAGLRWLVDHIEGRAA